MAAAVAVLGRAQRRLLLWRLPSLPCSQKKMKKIQLDMDLGISRDAYFSTKTTAGGAGRRCNDGRLSGKQASKSDPTDLGRKKG